MVALPTPRRLSRLQQPATWLVLFTVIALGAVIDTVEAQTTRSLNSTTDPAQALALNTIFSRWRLSASDRWNISGELCTGAAINDAIPIAQINPGIKCDCSGNTACRITGLMVYALSVEGPLPDELWNLTSLTDLNLGQNLLTGPIPASIANLSRMEYLSLGINALSGELPAELGELTRLISLAIGTNNFSGPLPSSLGNLQNLQYIFFDSAGVSGPIPSTFANLTGMLLLSGSDNELTGQIPDFIGSWSSLNTLRLQGNAFEGPIPSSFIGLTAMTDLRISELSNGSSSSLDFLRNMSSLSTVILRNNNISGTIPLFSSEFQSLTLVDLSFNNLTGGIPDSLFNLERLSHLFLGNNVLTGALPTQKIQTLLNIDLSYNNLSGTFPSWITQPNLQLNFVANNFTVNNSDISGLPSGLRCLQSNFPCGRGEPIYSTFAVKCGGLQIRGSDRTTYESDNETLGPATYYVTSARRWGVSNVGLPSNNIDVQYQSSSQSQFTNTLDSELFQTARISAGSLRYYGLGLENGNYTVTLQFAESQILNTRSWQSLGRRVFDVYIQGNRVLRDFDIQRAAGRTSLRAVTRNFTASVRDNYIEVHLFWAGKGTCCVPRQGTYGPSISAIHAVPLDFTPTVRNIPPGGNSNRTGLIAGVGVGVCVISLLALAAFCYVFQKRKRQRKFEDEELLGIDARPYTYSYAELKSATNDFNPANKLGEGGFGPVYKGTLGDGRAVAVKQLSVASHQGKSQFVAEIATISAVQHKNLVKLYGCCIEGDKRLLVYEYLENKSLDQLLFRTNSLYLDWPMRYEICLGVARGLSYLHEDSRVRIVHRDVKASNILLDADLTPKISDFGLAKLYDDKKTHISTRVAGTIGYLAPEYALRGQLTEKADIFGFGVVALEIISGRPNTDSTLEDDKTYLLELAWNLHESNRELDLVDHTLYKYDEEAVIRVICTALLCTQTSPGLRPPMSRVLAMLSGDIEVGAITSRPGYLTDWKFKDTTIFLSEDFSGTPNTEASHFNSSTSSTMVTDPNNSPMIATRPMLHDMIGEGR